MDVVFKPIAKIYNDFSTKFGIPRQGGISTEILSEIVFEKKFRNPDALRGIENYSHLWILWYARSCHSQKFSPTVRPPKLGGNTHMGVFATRSPFRPNPVCMTCVKLEKTVADPNRGTVLVVSGADIMNGTEILDIKPYLRYCDSKPDATNGFALASAKGGLKIKCDGEILEIFPKSKRDGLFQVLSQDPRPAYQNDDRIYVMPFGGFEISFRVEGEVLEIVKIQQK